MKKVEFFVLLSFSSTIVQSGELIDYFKVSKRNVCPPTNSTFLILSSISIDQCVNECTLRSHCHVIGYKTLLPHRICELHTSSNTPDITDSHCVLIRRKDINEKRECRCNNWEVCSTEGPLPCIRKECPPPTPIQHGTYLGNRNDIGTRKRVLCHKGYIKQDNISVIECLKSGEWNQTMTCIPVDCGDLPWIEKGSLSLDTFGHTTFEATATVNCKFGYRASAGSILCTASAEWQTASCDFVCPSDDGNLSLPDGHRIQIFMNKTTHSEALANCSALGMGLLMLDELWKGEWIFKVLKTCEEYKSRQYWIEGRLENLYDSWQYSDGTNILNDTFDEWKSDHLITRFAYPRCITINHLYMQDRYCERDFAIICQEYNRN